MQNVDRARCFVGLDAHFEHSSIKAINRKGSTLVEMTVPTTVRALRAVCRKIDGPAWVILEASSMSFFVKEAIAPVVDRVIVCETRENHWIAKSETKGDIQDADRLARLLRMGEFQEVHIPERPRQEIRELVLGYRKAVGDVVRAKNRLNAAYKKHGIAITSEAYDPEGRAAWVKRLGRPSPQALVEAQYGILDAAACAQDMLGARLHGILSHTKEYRLLCTLPGVGPVVAAIFIAVIDAPERFAAKRKLWAYAGLGLRRQWSGNAAKAMEGGSRSGNRLLKYAAMTAAQTAITGKNRFARHFADMTAHGIAPEMAKKTIARNILASARAMWINGSAYRDDIRVEAA